MVARNANLLKLDEYVTEIIVTGLITIILFSFFFTISWNVTIPYYENIPDILTSLPDRYFSLMFFQHVILLIVSLWLVSTVLGLGIDSIRYNFRKDLLPSRENVVYNISLMVIILTPFMAFAVMGSGNIFLLFLPLIPLLVCIRIVTSLSTPSKNALQLSEKSEGNTLSYIDKNSNLLLKFFFWLSPGFFFTIALIFLLDIAYVEYLPHTGYLSLWLIAKYTGQHKVVLLIVLMLLAITANVLLMLILRVVLLMNSYISGEQTNPMFDNFKYATPFGKLNNLIPSTMGNSSVSLFLIAIITMSLLIQKSIYLDIEMIYSVYLICGVVLVLGAFAFKAYLKLNEVLPQIPEFSLETLPGEYQLEPLAAVGKLSESLVDEGQTLSRTIDGLGETLRDVYGWEDIKPERRDGNIHILGETLAGSPHLALIGQTGSGKTTYCKHVILKNKIVHNACIVVFDRHWEYKDVADKVVQFGETRKEDVDFFIPIGEIMSTFSLAEFGEGGTGIIAEALQHSGLIMTRQRIDELIESYFKEIFDLEEGKVISIWLDSPNKIINDLIASIIIKKLMLLSTSGRTPSRTIIVNEEAQRLKNNEWVRTVSSEGRKFGLFLISISQRPDFDEWIIGNSILAIFKLLPKDIEKIIGEILRKEYKKIIYELKVGEYLSFDEKDRVWYICYVPLPYSSSES